MKRWIVTFGGLGLIPGMPGTYASLGTAVLFYLVWSACGSAAYGVVAVLIVLATLAGFWLIPWAQDHFKANDPGQFVLDEVAGQLLTLLIVFLLGLALKPLASRPLATVVAGFLFFRVFDVSKPWPIRNIEEMRGGWGVMLDDLAGAVYAAVGLALVIYVVRVIVGAEMYDTVSRVVELHLPTVLT